MRKIKDVYLPGSEWVYYKVYMSEESADRFLTHDFFPLLKQLYALKIINNCFFIRYRDSFPHLRIRFKINQRENFALLINIMFVKMEREKQKKECWKVVLDTYQREIERYGARMIELSEKIFGFDSVCLLNLLRLMKNNNSDNKRWMLAIPLIDSFFNIFELDLDNKAKIMAQLAKQYKSEFGFNEFNSKQFNELNRKYKNIIDLLIRNKMEGELWIKVFKLIRRKYDSIYSELHNEKINFKTDQSTVFLNFITSHIHMMFNRLFKSQARVHEMVIYELLSRYYKGQLAKMKYNRCS